MATKITYATLGGESLEDLHRELDAAIASAPSTFGREHLLYINGTHLKADAQFDDRSPIDTSIVLGTFQKGNREHVKSAVAAARAAYQGWADLPWQERLVYVRRIADAIRNHRYELSALMGYEVGKNRLECVGDVEEAADLMSYYCDQIEHHQGFVERMGTLGPGEDNVSVLRPYG
ncbi:MAG TPA: aldehyde dehydrogenase family protein, partial [Vicinamibacterales bacterium]|nr:aldehyde dehydrogenase family protein [Vicinamibacterales bacterium]